MLALTLKNMSETPFHIDTVSLEAEEQQVRAAQENPRHFEPLYVKYYERIARFIYHRAGDKEMAFDITSQVFYKALANLSKYKNTGVPFSAWLYRIASNELAEWYRKNKRRGVLNIDTVGLNELKNNVEEISTAAQDEKLFGALQDLEQVELELVNMRFFEKRSFREISDILQAEESACKMKLYRILDKLKAKLTVK